MGRTSPGGSFISLAAEQRTRFVVCHAGHLAQMRGLLHREPSWRAGDCLFFPLSDGEDAPGLLVGINHKRLLDRFHLVQESDTDLREQLLSGFFDGIAEDYQQLIHPQQNLANIQALVDWLLQDLQAGAGTLIDLGCGTGTSREIIERTGRSVIGVESSPRMRALAESAGMRVVEPQEVSTLPLAAGALASYVLHLDPTPRELPALLGRLPQGASFVANLHKGQGLAELEGYVAQIGAKLEHGPYDQQHGRYVRVHA
jgi:SAM-dependent methyltransferase